MSTELTQAHTDIEYEIKAFELEQRKAKIYSDSSLVPKEYQKNIGNVLIAKNMASRMNADVLQVMQNLYIVHGKPSWSAQFLIACFNTCGRFSAIKYREVGEPGTDSYGVQAYATELSSGEEVAGVPVTWEMVKGEGWQSKNGSKWKTIPGLMFQYRAATFLVRTTAPEIGLGLHTKDEIEDSYVDGSVVQREQPRGVARLKDKLRIETDESEAFAKAFDDPEINGGEISDEEQGLREQLDKSHSVDALMETSRAVLSSGLTTDRKNDIKNDIDERLAIIEESLA